MLFATPYQLQTNNPTEWFHHWLNEAALRVKMAGSDRHDHLP
jgi:hypothetical protein